MRKKPLFLLLLLLLISLLANARQNKIDSLLNVLKTERDDTNKVNTLRKLCLAYIDSNSLDNALLYANVIKSLAEKISFKNGIARAYSDMGTIYTIKGDLNKAMDYNLKALDIDQQIGDKYNEEIDLQNIGSNYFSKAKYPEALQYSLKAQTLAEELKDKVGLAHIYSGIGGIYFIQNDSSKAIEYNLKALVTNRNINYKSGIAEDLKNLGVIYFKINHLKGIHYTDSALAINKEIGNRGEIAFCLGNLAQAYLQVDNKMTIDYGYQALKMDMELGNKQNISYDLTIIGGAYINMKNYKRAKDCFDSALITLRNGGDIFGLADIYMSLIELDTDLGDYKRGFGDLLKFKKYSDSATNLTHNMKTVEIEKNFEFEQKQAMERAEQDKKDAKQKIIIWSVGGGLLLVLVFAGFIFRSLRITRSQKQVIEVKSKETEEQKKIIEEKQKDILDSINYAKRLQDAILPPLSLIKQALPQSFVFYKPKDIVAGDFYWMERAGDNILIAAADCTGHGVPGAMVSVVCSNALNRTVKEFKITETGKILNKVRGLVLETFEKSESNVQDGMDISLLCLNTKTNEGQWSGAFNSLWYVQNNEIHELAADKQPIGKNDNPAPFTSYNLKLKKGDTFYLFTDGYADQFGGPKGKKFKYKQLQEKLLAISTLNVDDQKQTLEETFNNWKGTLEQVDDVLIIGIKI